MQSLPDQPGTWHGHLSPIRPSNHTISQPCHHALTCSTLLCSNVLHELHDQDVLLVLPLPADLIETFFCGLPTKSQGSGKNLRAQGKIAGLREKFLLCEAARVGASLLRFFAQLGSVRPLRLVVPAQAALTRAALTHALMPMLYASVMLRLSLQVSDQYFHTCQRLQSGRDREQDGARQGRRDRAGQGKAIRQGRARRSKARQGRQTGQGNIGSGRGRGYWRRHSNAGSALAPAARRFVCIR